MQNSRWSICSYIISVLAITLLSYFHYAEGKFAVINYDVTGYYAYLPGALIYKDLKQLDWRDDIIEKYRISGLDNCTPEHNSGAKVIKYPVGMSISYLPAFLAAHGYALNSQYPADGFSLPYRLGLVIIGWIYMLIALWYLRKLLSLYYEDWIVAATLAIVAIGTNYYIYAGSQSMMSHAFLFLLFVLIIYHTILWYRKPTISRIISIGALLGLATITRQTEVLLTLVVLFWSVSNKKELIQRCQLFAKYKFQVLAAIFSGMLILSIQLIYWKYTSGDWIVYSYKGEGFTWDGRYLIECFFGFRKGWLVYTPIMLLGIIGLYNLYKSQKTRRISLPIIIFLITSTYIIFSWDNYWYGGGFGQRAMISSYALFAFAIAAFLKALTSKHIAVKIVTVVFIIFCIWLNIFQSFQAQVWGGFETDVMNKKYYLKIFGQKDIDPDWKILLDNKDAVLGKVKLSEPIFRENFENYLGTDERPYKNSKTLKLDKRGVVVLLDTVIHTIEKNDILRAEIMTSSIHRVWNKNKMSNLHIQLLSKGNVLSDQSVRIQRVARNSDWKPIKVDIKARHNNIDQLKVLAWCGVPENIVYLDALKIYKIE